MFPLDECIHLIRSFYTYGNSRTEARLPSTILDFLSEDKPHDEMVLSTLFVNNDIGKIIILSSIVLLIRGYL